MPDRFVPIPGARRKQGKCYKPGCGRCVDLEPAHDRQTGRTVNVAYESGSMRRHDEECLAGKRFGPVESQSGPGAAAAAKLERELAARRTLDEYGKESPKPPEVQREENNR